MSTDFKSRLKQQEVLLGPLVTLASREVAEILSQVGFDYLWIDMEHAPIDLAQAQAMIQATAGRCACLVRVPGNEAVWIKRVLDTGCEGIIIPQIKTVAEAHHAIAACQYPPEGTRSVGIARAQGYGMTLQESLAHASERLSIVLQIEHVEAVNNIEGITQLPGLDAVLIGPFDLSGSMGLTGQISHPDVQNAMDRVRQVCKRRSMPVGIFATDAAGAKAWIESGFTLIALGTDTMYLWKEAKRVLDHVRQQPLQ